MDNPYYVYYDNKTRNIISVTNQKNDSYDYGIVVSFEEIENFLTGKWHFKDFKVDYLAGSTELKIISNLDQGFNFESHEFGLIDETEKYSEFIVEWNLPNKSWHFQLDSIFKKTFNGVFNSKLLFFVTLESDLDLLVRTIIVDADELMDNYHVTVPFENEIEHEITKISISTRKNFKNYKLKVVYDN